MRIQGTVEDGTGTNSRTVDPATLTTLGYTPHRGTLNLKVNPALRLAVMELTGHDINGITYWPTTIEGHGQGHARVSRDRKTIELLHPHRLRDTLTNGDKVTITVRPQPRWHLSATIMAHPVRAEAAEELQASLDRPAPIVYDTNPVPSSNRAQRWATGRAAWEAHDPTADAHIVLQDDALVCADFLAGLETALDQFETTDFLVSPYTGTGRPNQRACIRALEHADKHGHTWMSLRSLYWGVAVCAPTHTITDMLTWCSAPRRAGYINQDKNIGEYYRDILRWRTWYTVPSLVEHRGLPSLLGHDHGPPRRAHRWHSTSALDLDWSRVPPTGLAPTH